MTDEQMMLMLRLAFHAGVHRGETKEKHRVGQLAVNYVAPNFEDFFEGIDPFPKTPNTIKIDVDSKKAGMPRHTGT